MSDTTGSSNGPKGHSLFSIPKSPLEFKPPKPRSMTAEMAALQRNKKHWDEVLPYLEALSGRGPSIFGSAKYDETGCIFEVQRICQANGYTLLANANPAKLSRVFKLALKENIGMSFRQLQQQGKQLRLEFKQGLRNKPYANGSDESAE